jgi:5S rRNA maturation endonuclease (ribonuclease M5)
LSAHLKEKEEKILLVLECLSEENARGTPIIVEGKNDIQALRTLGFEGRLVTAKTGGKSLLDVVSELEETETQKVILLLDYDRRGKEWTRRLKQLLERTGISPETAFWTDLFSLVGRQVKDVEGLAAYMETMKKALEHWKRLKREIHNS